MDDYDHVTAGAASAGCVLAARFAEDLDARVLPRGEDIPDAR
jgi:choline dehydrogenase-like flavoprotein